MRQNFLSLSAARLPLLEDISRRQIPIAARIFRGDPTISHFFPQFTTLLRSTGAVKAVLVAYLRHFQAIIWLAALSRYYQNDL